MNNKKRLFTFGCSFTNYKWPTWADILGREFDYFENWGKGGAGNKFIFHALIECHQKNKFTPNDTIIIMWSTTDREDRYIKNHWRGNGSVYHHLAWPKEFVKDYFDWRGNFLCDVGLISAATNLLKSWNVNFNMLAMMPLDNLCSNFDYLKEDQVTDILDLFKDVIDNIKPSVFEVIFNSSWGHNRLPKKEEIIKIYKSLSGNDWPPINKFLERDLSGVNERFIKEIFDNIYLKAYFDPKSTPFVFDVGNDLHPVPLEHLKYLDTILPEYNISNKTREWVEMVNDCIVEKKLFDDLWTPTAVLRV